VRIRQQRQAARQALFESPARIAQRRVDACDELVRAIASAQLAEYFVCACESEQHERLIVENDALDERRAAWRDQAAVEAIRPAILSEQRREALADCIGRRSRPAELAGNRKRIDLPRIQPCTACFTRRLAILSQAFVETAVSVVDSMRPPARISLLDEPARQRIGLAIHARTACSSPARRASSIAPSTPARPCSAETQTEFSTQPSGSCGGR
jgi:hypothetical protein